MYRSQGPYLYSPLSRALYERLQTDIEMKNFDKNQVSNLKIILLVHKKKP